MTISSKAGWLFRNVFESSFSSSNVSVPALPEVVVDDDDDNTDDDEDDNVESSTYHSFALLESLGFFPFMRWSE